MVWVGGGECDFGLIVAGGVWTRELRFSLGHFSAVVTTVCVERDCVCELGAAVVFLSCSLFEEAEGLGAACRGEGNVSVKGRSVSADSRCCFRSL